MATHFCVKVYKMSGFTVFAHVFFFDHTFRSFFAETFWSLNNSVICLTVVLKLTITVFFSLYCQTF